jgi:hypothetical protein
MNFILVSYYNTVIVLHISWKCESDLFGLLAAKRELVEKSGVVGSLVGLAKG